MGIKRKRTVAPKKKYWYRHHVGECPVCGQDMGWKEKIYGEKPKDLKKVFVQLTIKESFNHCI